MRIHDGSAFMRNSAGSAYDQRQHFLELAYVPGVSRELIFCPSSQPGKFTKVFFGGVVGEKLQASRKTFREIGEAQQPAERHCHQAGIGAQAALASSQVSASPDLKPTNKARSSHKNEPLFYENI